MQNVIPRELIDVNKQLVELMEYVVSEWESDPMSVQCFDLRMVAEAKRLVKRRKELKRPFATF